VPSVENWQKRSKRDEANKCVFLCGAPKNSDVNFD
jgi:hypothetical protein